MWPDKIIRQFCVVPPNPSESDYYGPYNKLLYTLFPPDSEFVVVPQYLPDIRNPADFTAIFEILLLNKPVFILELKPPGHYNVLSARQAADEQIRRHMADVITKCPIETLYAVSALGTKLSFYSLDTATLHAEIVPTAIPRHPTRINDTAPADRWDCDILDPVGEERFCRIVKEIFAECERLCDKN